MLEQFDRLRRRNAFIEQYRKEKIFQDSLEEFDDARSVLTCLSLSQYDIAIADCSLLLCTRRATAEELLKEYKACESPDYITYVRPFVTNPARFLC